ncbi:MAG: hypothetical protein KatS3mg011_1035 [Acidimicrobiia bacterium]|nr:MAG: hypothetical protein KatS3mg011_1035 [Acidimicrobiia bacterium]
MASAHTYTLIALTDIWTGSVRLEERNGQLRERIVPERLITTGLLGSIRWWFEVLVRGLGSSACDPTQTECQDRGHCVVCELFGCTGWARKFRFEVLEKDEKVHVAQIKKDQDDGIFKLRFTELRPVKPEEWALLDLTLRFIADYGAIGGKTVLKPSDEPSRANAAHHDYGLIEIQQRPEKIPSLTRKKLEEYVSPREWRTLDHDGFRWASLENFWYVKGRYLARQSTDKSSFNRVVGRKEPKNQGRHLRTGASDLEKWLAGHQRESKKVFSFKYPESARRTFGFVPSTDNLGEMRQRLKYKAWKDLGDDEFLDGGAILARLLSAGGTR